MKASQAIRIGVRTAAAISASWLLLAAAPPGPPASVPRFGVYEVELTASGSYVNPYTDLAALAEFTGPDGATVRRLPLFWDGGDRWKFRFSPDEVGVWRWTVHSADQGLDKKSGEFAVRMSGQKGSIRPMGGFPLHFERQDGSRFWFLGDTAWALYTDSRDEGHDGAAARRYIEARATQGFNVLHSMLLSEAGWGNAGGPPFEDIAGERINPAYWREVDRRLAFANEKGIVCGLAVGWGDKGRQEPYAWHRFPSVESRRRYARYVGARYSAYDVYFIVSGEWHAEVRARASTDERVRQEFIGIGNALQDSDPHGRLIAIHPMTSHGSVREFTGAKWMGFGDYQQNYRDLHSRVLESRRASKPVVNSEYGYFLRDQSGDGVPDKDNSTSIESMRYATWDILMAGGYVVTGFGTTYFGGNRDPGPFDLHAAKNRPWETQIGHARRLFGELEWWKLEPHDDLLQCATPRGGDSRELNRIAPPETAYWCLAEAGRQYLIYVRGVAGSVTLASGSLPASLPVRQLNPRTGELTDLPPVAVSGRYEYQPPDEQDWAVIVR